MGVTWNNEDNSKFSSKISFPENNAYSAIFGLFSNFTELNKISLIFPIVKDWSNDKIFKVSSGNWTCNCFGFKDKWSFVYSKKLMAVGGKLGVLFVLWYAWLIIVHNQLIF